jgi:hypothetical protein
MTNVLKLPLLYLSLISQFHTKCILTWLATRPSCPLCQEPISDSKRKPVLTDARSLPIQTQQLSSSRERIRVGAELAILAREQIRQNDAVSRQVMSVAEEQMRRNTSVAPQQAIADDQANERGAKFNSGSRTYCYIDHDSARFTAQFKIF